MESIITSKKVIHYCRLHVTDAIDHRCENQCDTCQCKDALISNSIDNKATYVRFPNESVAIKFISYDATKFKKDKTIGKETFGWYDGVYVAISNK